MEPEGKLYRQRNYGRLPWQMRIGILAVAAVLALSSVFYMYVFGVKFVALANRISMLAEAQNVSPAKDDIQSDTPGIMMTHVYGDQKTETKPASK